MGILYIHRLKKWFCSKFPEDLVWQKLKKASEYICLNSNNRDAKIDCSHFTIHDLFFKSCSVLVNPVSTESVLTNPEIEFGYYATKFLNLVFIFMVSVLLKELPGQ